MGYLVLARKWRPRRFDDLVGQGPIVQILANAISQSKISHAYIFAGPRGVGKTTAARILAMGLNCTSFDGPTSTPCGVCSSCVSITDGSSVDVLEIDGASNNSVDDVRDLRERVKYAPSGRYKVYIIDEAHMLSTSAFNALLKTLEEPPPHVVFVMATTEAKKVPATVLSRCQHMPFRRVSTSDIKARLAHIVSTDGIGITDDALSLVARAADGSMRDGLTILDQVTSFSEHVNEDDVKGLLDISDFRTLHSLALACTSGDRAGVLAIVSDLVGRGTDLRGFGRDLIKHFRDLLVVKIMKADTGDALELTSEEMAQLKQAAEGLSEEHLSLILNELIKAEGEIKFSSWPRVALEMALLKVSYLTTFSTLKDAIAALGHGHPKPVEHAPALKMPAPRPPAPKMVKAPIVTDEPPVEEDEPPVEEDELVDIAPMDADSLLDAMLRGMNTLLSSHIGEDAVAALDGDTLSITITGDNVTHRRDSLDKKSALLQKLASDIRHTPTKVAILIGKTASVAAPSVDLKARALADPTVKEVMDLFEGRLVDYKAVE